MADFIEFQYPADLMRPPFDKWISFRVKAGRHVIRTVTAPEAGDSDRDLAVVHLYLPESALKSTLNSQWAGTDLGPFAGKIIQEIAQSASNLAEINFSSLNSMWENGKAVFSGFGEMLSSGTAGGVGEAIKRAFETGGEAGKVSLFKGVDAMFGEGLAQAATGQRVNPRTDMLFQAQQYRTHSFEFMMVPRNKEEAIAIDNIVQFFQFYMLPSYKGEKDPKSMGYMMGFPYEFEIGMYSAQSKQDNYRLRHVAQIGRSVLTTTGVDHAAGGKVAFIRDADVVGDAGRVTHFPVATTLSLEFQECRLLGRGDEEIVRSEQYYPDPRK